MLRPAPEKPKYHFSLLLPGMSSLWWGSCSDVYYIDIPQITHLKLQTQASSGYQEREDKERRWTNTHEMRNGKARGHPSRDLHYQHLSYNTHSIQIIASELWCGQINLLTTSQKQPKTISQMAHISSTAAACLECNHSVLSSRAERHCLSYE